jgi:hypothetical protein
MTHRSPRVQAMAALAVTATVAIVLGCFPPSAYSFYPACPIHAWFGIECPGCGGTRAAAALISGRWAEAVRQNALIVALSPLLLAGAALQAGSALRSNRWRPVQVPLPLAGCLLATAALFTVARNVKTLFW